MNTIHRLSADSPAIFASEYIEYVREVLTRIDAGAVGRFIGTLLDARARGACVYFIGNGGSAATASHFANDLANGTRCYDKPFRAVSLTDNTSAITAIANDFGFDDIFVRQLRVLGRTGDVLVAISASGNSTNLVTAFEYAKSAGIRTVAMTAFDGGRLRAMADECLHVPTGQKEYGPAEDVHIVLDHLISAYLSRVVQHE